MYFQKGQYIYIYFNILMYFQKNIAIFNVFLEGSTYLYIFQYFNVFSEKYCDI